MLDVEQEMDIPNDAGIADFLASHSDEQLYELLTDLGGHDMEVGCVCITVPHK